VATASAARPSARAMVAPTVRTLTSPFKRSLLAANRSPRTVESYGEALAQFTTFLERNGMPSAVAHLRREHVEAFLAELLSKFRPATAANRYRGLQQFFHWAVQEGEIKVSPMVNMQPPNVPDAPPPMLNDADLGKLLRACAGTDFSARRDTALICLLLDTGCRRSEIAGLVLDDLDLDNCCIHVTGKGARPRTVPYGRKTAHAIDRYLRVRAQHRDAERPELWVGRAGPMTPNGIHQTVKDRGAQAGLEGLHSHIFRHGFAHAWLSNGGQEGDLMRLAGWKSRQMLARYGASAADQRAREAYRKQMSPGDRL